MKNILAWIIVIILIIRIIPPLVEEHKKNTFLKKNKKQIETYKKRRKELPEYKLLTKIQLFGLLIIPIGTLLLANSPSEYIEASAGPTGLYILLLIFTSVKKENLPVDELFNADLAKHGLTYDNEKNIFYGNSSMGTPISFSCKIIEGKSTIRPNRVGRISPSFALYYYTLQIAPTETDFINVCKDTVFLNKLAEENEKDFIDHTVIQFNSEFLLIATQAKAYTALSDTAFSTQLFIQAYENAEELVQLISKEAENKRFY